MKTCLVVDQGQVVGSARVEHEGPARCGEVVRDGPAEAA